ncbi:ABC transporter substrate-binding protein [Aquamicrobium zhengzhouense]|uniref:Peptide ABC transporter substrate-binding protein n=1 Tax=Aquamicrobium zhengzhouense TaxID=2781738 RepID=A0ABS0SGR0_9HYPH|nr:ABC transporter substrate-binding protein [Aquamicrobium zhengzhouense]MBI1622498.1 peptide ABC transporter substrate-binding protein [Aquamicrobium zhengzhouense]
MQDELNYLAQLAARQRLSRRAFLGRAAALGVAASSASMLLSNAARAAGPIKGGTLRIGMVGGESSDGLDPAAINNQVKGVFARCWGEKLLDVAEDGTLVPYLATEYGASPDAKVWTFKIRKGVTFHNGKELEAEDVRATIERHAGESSRSGALGILGGIDRLEASGDEFIVTLKEPNADLPYLLTDYHLIIQPNGGMDNPEAGIGTGPYNIGSHEPGVREIAARYENYWASDERGHAEQVEIIVINDTAARFAAIQSGQVHLMNRVEPKVVDFIKRLPNVSIQNITGSAHYTFAMQCITPPFDDNDLRLALKYAIDREAILEKILGGYGTVGNDIPVNSAYAYFSEDIEQRVYDPDKAAFHFKKSGHDGPIALQTSDVAFPGAVDAALLFQQSAEQAGIKLDVQRMPGDGYWAEVWNTSPFSASYWIGRPTQDQQYSTAYVSSADWNETRFRRPEFDAKVIAARAELDDVKRKAIYRDMAMMVRDEGGAIIPVFNDWVDAVSNKVGGFTPHPAGELMYGRAPFKCWLQE